MNSFHSGEYQVHCAPPGIIEHEVQCFIRYLQLIARFQPFAAKPARPRAQPVLRQGLCDSSFQILAPGHRGKLGAWHGLPVPPVVFEIHHLSTHPVLNPVGRFGQRRSCFLGRLRKLDFGRLLHRRERTFHHLLL